VILKIAFGVFLGMAAWTYRADIGVMFLYTVMLFIGALIVFWCYQLIANPIKMSTKEKEIKKLTDELMSLDLIETQSVGALTLGLMKTPLDDDFKSINAILIDYKKERRNGEDGDFYKSQIKKTTDSVVENFKQSVEK
jgi:hypothetical protein